MLFNCDFKLWTKSLPKTAWAPGYFEQELLVYGREGEPCKQCGRVLRHASIGQRASVWCGHCQR